MSSLASGNVEKDPASVIPSEARNLALSADSPNPIFKALTQDEQEKEWGFMLAWMRKKAENDPVVLRVLSLHPEIQVAVQRRMIELSDQSLKGRTALLISEGFFDSGATGYQVWHELGRRGVGSAKPNVYTACAELCTMGFLTAEKDGNSTNYKRVPGLKITKKEIST
jgi:hypothetical protein